MRQLGFWDRLITECDEALKTLFIKSHVLSTVQSPAQGLPEPVLSTTERRHSEALMRVDHTGEICAQALYRGQALCAKDQKSRDFLLHAAIEESNHLAWTQQRLNALQGRPSFLNPFWYTLSFGLGVAVSFGGDALSLGFVMETEAQVLQHLDQHLMSLPERDEPSRAVLLQMREDEAHHANQAELHGGEELPFILKGMMKLQSQLMTRSTYYV